MATTSLLFSDEATEDEPQGYDPMLEEAEGAEDVPVAPFDGLTVADYIKACRDESKQARLTREALNQINYDAEHCRQDLSAKVRGQSAEFLPKTSMALEQLSAFIKRGLVAFGNWFSVELSPNPAFAGGPLTESGIIRLMRHRLEDPGEIPVGCQDFPTTISDGIKTGGLGSLIVLKVCGQWVPTRRLSVDTRPLMGWATDPITGQSFETVVGQEENLSMIEGKVWRLVVELVRPEDYYPDPTGRGLYEIHRTRKDLHEVIAMAEEGEYDAEAVAELAGSFTDYETQRRLARETDQDTSQPPSFRKEIELLEFWGTVLDSSGNVVERNVRATLANDRFLIRRPAPNPYWHQESPFIVAPLLRVPFSVFHRALFDHAVRLNLAMNEIFNLILDGGIGAVWGVRQVKLGLVDNAEDFTDGIPQGATIFVKDEAPDGVPVMNQLPAGVVPAEALQVYQLLDREFAAATLLSDTARGQVPRKEVSATAVASADQSSSAFFDSIVAMLEQAVIQKVLRLAWLTMLQNCDDWNAEDVAGCIGPEAAKALAQMSSATRYATYAQGARFKVSGLSSMVARTREFQKITAALSLIGQSPVLLQTFMAKYSPEKLLDHILKALNLDPEDMQMTEEEKASLQQRIASLPHYQGVAQGAQGNQQSQGGTNQEPGSPVQQTQAFISQLNQPPQGL